MDLSTVDQETSRLIVQLQIEDISDILCINPRRPAEVGLSSDLGVALEQYKRDLEQAHLFCHGVDIAQLLEATLNLDRDSGSVGSETNTEFLTAEESLADGWGRMTVDPVPAKHNDNESLSAECICCGLRRRGAVVATPCGHNYCGQCIITLVEKALVDESLFPPRCCKTEMTIEIVEPFLTDDQIKAFADKTIEFGTSDRTYCHQATCSAFIPTSPLGEQIATCDKCGAKTCTVCKGESHESPDCPKDTVTQDVLRLAGENGWQRCQKCNRMIELNTGCNHISKSLRHADEFFR
ncbi:hypothetical protein QQS21_010722 [Conoideocrella luteorostrata]|uniref:RBR-type E3 ubiquitin transferase n=1 Tax=Conoideocrella luteorostrata TaxID=1105319 RepID=A0AAJ0CEH2_9HYPO|nr:hypothetical protein QQS21_010722 [Conoideocrella luteorostrata]